MKTLLQDMRYGFRVIRKNPVFVAVIVFTLALGIAANSAVFSVFNTVLLRPLPFQDPEQLVALWETIPKFTGRNSVSHLRSLCLKAVPDGLDGYIRSRRFS